jgi:Tfp pilus assembly protein PilF
LRRREEGRTTLEKVVKDAPQSATARVALAEMLLGENDAAAEEQLRAAVAAIPDDELANRALAVFYVNAGRTGEAEEYLKRAAAAPQQKLRSVLALADFYAAEHRYDSARAVLSTAQSRRDLVDGATRRREALERRVGEP